MRILYHYRILAIDGMNVHIRAIVDALEREGHDVLLVGPSMFNGPSRVSITQAIGAIRHRLPAWLTECLEMLHNVKDYIKLKRAIRAFKPDFIYERYNLFLVAGAWVRRLTGIPLLLEINAPLAEERQAHGKLSLIGMANLVERFTWNAADMTLPVSEALASHLHKRGVAREKVAVRHNGVDQSVFEPDVLRRKGLQVRRDLGLRDTAIVFGFVGFVRPWHGLDQVLTAFAELDMANLHLLIVGDGPARADLEVRARRLGLASQLTFTGMVEHEDVPAYLGAFDVALQPEVTPYASPLKLFEYMAAGCAIIAPTRDNILEIVRDKESALLIEPGSSVALKDAIAQLATDEPLRKALGRGARRAITDQGFTWRNNAQAIVKLARPLVEGRAGSRPPIPVRP